MSPTGIPAQPDLQTQVEGIFEKIREPLGLDRWQIQLVNGEYPDARAWCEPHDEYREAVIGFDFDKLKTGDDLAEVVVHEATHCHTGDLHDIALELADALSECQPEASREAFRKLLCKRVNKAAERTTTDVGHAYLRLLRRAAILDTPPATT